MRFLLRPSTRAYRGLLDSELRSLLVSSNAFIERFNRTYREAVLDRYLFRNIQEIQNITDHWLKHYNEERPHEALNNQTPLYYSQSLNKNYSI